MAEREPDSLPPAYCAAAALEQSLGDPRNAASAVSFERAVALDEAEAYPAAHCDALISRGYLRAMVPIANGGTFHSFEEAAALQRAVSRRDLTCAIALGQSFLGSLPIWLGGNEAQRARAAELMLSGQSMALALTEEEHGSDVLANEMRAQRIGEQLQLDGRKWLINNGTRAAALTLFARTDGAGGLHGHSLIFLDKARIRSGVFEPLAKIRTHGIRGADISGFVLRGACVDADSQLGAEGSGAELLLQSLQLTRTGCASFSLGAADSALRLALDFARARQLYGGALIDLPHARAQLAEAFVELLLCDAMATACARAIHTAPEQLSLWSSAVKYFVPVTCEGAMRKAALVLGARHYLREQFASGAFQKLLRDAAVVSLFDGSTAVNLDSIGVQLLRLGPRRAAKPEERAQTLSAMFAFGEEVAALDPSRLALTNLGRCDVSQGVSEARAKLEQPLSGASYDTALADSLRASAEQLEQAFAQLQTELEALRLQQRTEVKRTPALFALAERYCSLFAGACALHRWLAAREREDELLADPSWVILCLQRAVGNSIAANPLLERLALHMLELHEQRRAFALLPIPLGR